MLLAWWNLTAVINNRLHLVCPGRRLAGAVYCGHSGKSAGERLLRRARVLPIGQRTATLASILIDSEVPLVVGSKTLGHSTLSTTVNIYGPLLPHATRDAVTALRQALNEASPPSAIPGGESPVLSNTP